MKGVNIMFKDALQYIVNLAKPEVQMIDGETYSDKNLHRISYNPKATAIEMTTLSSLIDYIKSGYDTMGKMIVHVQSPVQVRMYSALDDERTREHIAEVNAQLPGFDFNRFIDHESFCINVQSKFLPNDDRALLLKFAGTVEAGTVAEYGDDGITQKATVKTGIASKGDAVVPNPVTLKPFRTFVEVEQPSSQFVFRMQGNSCVQCALYEADGGAWKLEAMKAIKAYLETELKDIPDFVVIC